MKVKVPEANVTDLCLYSLNFSGGLGPKEAWENEGEFSITWEKQEEWVKYCKKQELWRNKGYKCGMWMFEIRFELNHGLFSFPLRNLPLWYVNH